MNIMCKTCPFSGSDASVEKYGFMCDNDKDKLMKSIEECASTLLVDEKQTQPHACFEINAKELLHPHKEGEKPCAGHQNWLKEKGYG